MGRRKVVGGLMGLATAMVVRQAPAKASKKRRCHPMPEFPANEFCPAGFIYANNIGEGVCVPRSGRCEGRDWYCKGHHHTQFHCDIDELGNEEAQCCRKNNHHIVHTAWRGKGLCHGWKPKLVCPPPVG